jgi:hypothetical protein
MMHVCACVAHGPDDGHAHIRQAGPEPLASSWLFEQKLSKNLALYIFTVRCYNQLMLQCTALHCPAQHHSSCSGGSSVHTDWSASFCAVLDCIALCCAGQACPLLASPA